MRRSQRGRLPGEKVALLGKVAADGGVGERLSCHGACKTFFSGYVSYWLINLLIQCVVHGIYTIQ